MFKYKSVAYNESIIKEILHSMTDNWEYQKFQAHNTSHVWVGHVWMHFQFWLISNKNAITLNTFEHFYY